MVDCSKLDIVLKGLFLYPVAWVFCRYLRFVYQCGFPSGYRFHIRKLNTGQGRALCAYPAMYFPAPYFPNLPKDSSRHKVACICIVNPKYSIWRRVRLSGRVRLVCGQDVLPGSDFRFRVSLWPVHSFCRKGRMTGRVFLVFLILQQDFFPQVLPGWIVQ